MMDVAGCRGCNRPSPTLLYTDYSTGTKVPLGPHFAVEKKLKLAIMVKHHLLWPGMHGWFAFNCNTCTSGNPVGLTEHRKMNQTTANQLN